MTHSSWSLLAAYVGWIGNPLSMFLAIRGRPAGWYVVIATQTAFVSFALATGAWQFYGQFACLIMGLYGIWRWKTKGVHKASETELAQDATIREGLQLMAEHNWTHPKAAEARQLMAARLGPAPRQPSTQRG